MSEDQPTVALTAILLFVLMYVVSPIAYWQWLSQQLERGAFPSNADSIAIPFAGFLVLWMAGLPLMLFTGTTVFKELRRTLEEHR